MILPTAQYKGAHNPLAVGDFRRLELKKDTNGWIEVKPYWYLDQAGDIDDVRRCSSI